MNRHRRSGFAAISLAIFGAPIFGSPIVAQSFVVDAANGPGANFVDIAAAITAVPDGATLLVRTGTYAPFTLQAKGLTILADPGTQVTGTTEILDTLPNQAVIVRGMEVDITAGDRQAILLQNCAGPVLLEGLTTPSTLPPYVIFGLFFYIPVGLRAANCDQVILRDSTLTGVALNASNTVVESCLLRGGDEVPISGNGSPPSAIAGLHIQSSSVEIVGNSLIIGGNAAAPSLHAVGIHASLSSVNVRSGTVSSGISPTSQISTPILISQSLVVVDPAVSLTGIAPTIFPAPTRLPLAETTSAGAPVGGAMQAQVASTSPTAAALFLSLPNAGSTAFPGIEGYSWLAPSTLSLEAIGTATAGAPLSTTVPVPNNAALRGFAIAWQALLVAGNGELKLSNPSLAIVR
ncbi:MAG: hypothetical protein AB8H80_09350 [Planctomycetota bacterium]